MNPKIVCVNNGCNNCNENVRCEECEKGLIQANKFFNSLINGPTKYKITLELDDSLVLPNKQVKGMTSNRRFWWIRKDNGWNTDEDDFIDIGKMEGNIKFNMNLELEKGWYSIGCGTPKNRIKRDFYVSKDECIFIK